MASRKHTSSHGRTEITRHSRTQWFYGLYRALPGDRAFLAPSSADMVLPRPGRARQTSADLTPTLRRQDHTTSPSASAPFVCAPRDRSQAVKPALRSLKCAGTAASTASHPNVRDDGQRPSSERDGENIEVIWIRKNRNIFANGTRHAKAQAVTDLPVGQIGGASRPRNLRPTRYYGANATARPFKPLSGLTT
jgi:hypothetical protein